MLKKLLKLIRILLPSFSYKLRDVIRQLTVTGHKPASEGNTVGLVVELLRIDIIEVLKLRILKYLRMQGRNSVDRVSEMDIDMCHMHPVLIIYDPHTFITVLTHYQSVKLLDDRNELGNHLLKVIKRPFLKSFRKDCMIRICACPAHNIDRFLHGKAFLNGKQSYELGNDHRRMCIIDLYRNIFIKLMKIQTLGLDIPKDHLRAVAYHEVLLIYP